LQTSPEFAMKRLLAAGAGAIYQIARAFRAGESGGLHNPEFTIVEWYRPGDSMEQGMALLCELAQALLGTPPAERISYAEAFRLHVGIDPHTATRDELGELAARWGIGVSDGAAALDRDGWLNLLLVHLVEPQLGQTAPTILYDYPPSQAALARIEGDPPVAKRFELYLRGIELANGYHELVDPAELRQRIQTANRQRELDGKAALPERSRLLAAMAHGLPDSTGVALGFDRLVMLAAGAGTLSEVLAFPTGRA